MQALQIHGISRPLAVDSIPSFENRISRATYNAHGNNRAMLRRISWESPDFMEISREFVYIFSRAVKSSDFRSNFVYNIISEYSSFALVRVRI